SQSFLEWLKCWGFSLLHLDWTQFDRPLRLPATCSQVSSVDAREREAERRTSFWIRRKPDFSPMPFNNRFGNEEAQSHAFRLGRKKWFEQPIRHGWINACAVVANAHLNPCSPASFDTNCYFWCAGPILGGSVKTVRKQID